MSTDREGFHEYETGKKIKREATTTKTTTDHAIVSSPSAMGRRHLPALPGTNLNTITPCAACKLLRRRCAEECPFSPYFSPHEPHKFAAVHKVFGASNVSKMLMEVPENQRADAANSLVYEANLRLRDPVYGCMGAISALQHQIQSLQAELNTVRAEIIRYKYREATAANNNNSNVNIIQASHGATAPLILPSPSVQVSVAAPTQPPPLNHPSHSQPQQPPLPPPTPPPLPLPSPSIVVSSSSSSSTTTSMYNPPSSSTAGYSSISSDNNVPYFD